MFYRFVKSGVRLPVDLDDLYQDEACFIAGGAPILAEFAELLGDLRPHILAINNAATKVPATMWIGGDKPDCIDRSILLDPTIMKFAVISRRDYDVEGVPWKFRPGTFFFGTKEGFNQRNFLERHRDLCWWKNTFFLALQLAYRLGFRTVYLVGCGFQIEQDKQYAWDTALSAEEVSWNQRLYNNSLIRLKELKPLFEKKGFRVVSSTPGSLANEVLEYRDPAQVLDEFAKAIPRPNTVALPHSSKVSKNASVNA